QRGPLRSGPTHQRTNRLETHVRCEGQETEANEPKGLPFHPLAPHRIQVGPQTPERGGAGRKLNEAIGPKAHQGDAARQESRANREHALKAVVAEGRVVQPSATLNEGEAIRDRCRCHPGNLRSSPGLPNDWRISCKRLARSCTNRRSIESPSELRV